MEHSTNENKKIEILKEIINASTVAKKIIPPSNVPYILNNNTDLSPILTSDRITDIEKNFTNVFDRNTLNFDNLLSNGNMSSNGNPKSNNLQHESNLMTKCQKYLPKSKKSNHNNENNDSDSENDNNNDNNDESNNEFNNHQSVSNKTHELKKKHTVPSQQENNLLNPVFKKNLTLYKNLNKIYDFKISANDSDFIVLVKKKINQYVIGTIEINIYNDYLKKIDPNLRAILNNFLNNIKTRNKFNEVLKTNDTKASNLALKVSAFNNILTNDKLPKLKNKIIVFTHLDKSLLPNLSVGQKIKDKKIGVFSYNPLENMEEFLFILKLSIPKNHRCLIVKPEQGFIYKDCEIILGSNFVYKINDISEIILNGEYKTIVSATLLK